MSLDYDFGESPYNRRTTDDQSADICEMLNACLENVDGSAYEFIESLNDWFIENGYLTPRQLMALSKFYSNCV